VGHKKEKPIPVLYLLQQTTVAPPPGLDACCKACKLQHIHTNLVLMRRNTSAVVWFLVLRWLCVQRGSTSCDSVQPKDVGGVGGHE
jgi:hypothetical protein